MARAPRQTSASNDGDDGSGTALRDWDPAVPSARLLIRHGAEVRAPASASRAPAQAAPRPTVYAPQRLILPGGDLLRPATAAVQEAAAKFGLTTRPAQLYPTPSTGRPPRRRTRFSETVELVPAADSESPQVAAPDAWRVLQQVRLSDPEIGARIGLEHLMFAPSRIGGQGPHFEGFGTGGQGPHFEGFAGGAMEYTQPGFGGRQVLTWVGRDPYRQDDEDLKCRRPVVAVLDTGCGRHPWFTQEARDGIRRSPLVAQGVRAGRTDDETDPERHGNLVGPLDGSLDSHAGHGTFICGLVRQICPEADLLTIRVMESDGVVHEGLLLDALEDLHTLLSNYQDDGPARYASPVDVLVLSLGYYHEEPDDADFDVPLRHVLDALTERGVVIVCAAGNEATTRPMYPAAFAPRAGSTPALNRTPVVSVGSENPDGSIALFSNAGPWVRAFEPGASLVSTVPVDLQGSGQATISYQEGRRTRSTIDPDDFRSGFAAWSGTSFAAPVLAGKIASQLLDDGGLDDPAPDAAVRRGWAAVEQRTSIRAGGRRGRR